MLALPAADAALATDVNGAGDVSSTIVALPAVYLGTALLPFRSPAPAPLLLLVPERMPYDVGCDEMYRAEPLAACEPVNGPAPAAAAVTAAAALARSPGDGGELIGDKCAPPVLMAVAPPFAL